MSNEERKAELMQSVIARVRERLAGAQADSAARFVSHYYLRVDPDDLVERSVDDLYGAALSHWHFAQRFSGAAPKLRVYNPTVPEHGWQCSHTVIEMVNRDMPFLVDSVTTEINRQGLTLHFIIHPVMHITRDAEGHISDAGAEADGAAGALESIIHAEVDRRTDAPCLEALEAGLLRVLSDVRAAVEDWQPMLSRIDEVLAEIERQPPPQDAAQTEEDRAFLRWIAAGNFTLLGYRNYDLAAEAGEDVLRVVPDSGLGILRGTGADNVSGSFALLPPQMRAQARARRLLLLAKSNARATVHRPGYLDYIGVKRFDAQGEVVGEHRFLGLFTSIAYNANPAEIPLLRRKLRQVIERAGYLPRSHTAKALVTLLEQYPRDELFQIGEDELFATAMGILRLGERQRTRLFMRRDAYGRFFSCLIFVPRERYNTELRERMQAILMEALGGVSAEFSVQLSESVLARVLLIIRTRQGSNPEVEVRDLEARLARAARRWQDDLAQALAEHCGEEAGNRLMARYGEGFPTAYREDVGARAAVYDVELMESVGEGDELAVSLYVPLEAPAGSLRFKIIRAGTPVTLSESLPMLEHMGVRVIDERPYRVQRRGMVPVWIHDFGMSHAGAAELPIEHLRAPFQEAFLRVWRREAENDDFNRLVLGAGLDWRQVSVLRAYAKYLRQAGSTFSQSYMMQTLAAYPAIAAALVRLFELRFDPARDGERAEQFKAGVAALRSELENVASLDEDRILHQFLAAIRASLRSNYYRRDAAGAPRAYLSFKFDPKQVPMLPEPRPMFEIFVYSPRMEGVHLRGGYVARGGLRWSDRMEDFRTEVLGLVKAQMVKNAVIVPVGSKGGFVLKQAPAGGEREALMKEGVACYRDFLRGLLDLTDNLVAGKVVAPPEVVRHDGDDAYLVVAADKGTASFSDYANEVAREYGFWLDDAFASGGSAGYDHKKMGITARGAWESVKRHFRELGVDTQSQDFSVVGIGDMSGDVFGNGMLASRHIRLLAAFDHRHIFIDPDPDAAASYAERERLFALPRSSWADYDAKLISAGGGVWSRSAKSIHLSPEARRALDIEAEALTPAELMRAILKAGADLLYNGGIGTYVKAGDERHLEVGDRANDAIRINAGELRCRVVGEGGNLGLTQRARIEYALAGGRIYTDAIDNSAGVDCSDHEVNIKILLNAVVADGELTVKQRNALLAQMTDEVAALVLRDNVLQTQILSITAAQGAELLDEQSRYLRYLEKAGRLNRAIEFLPDDEALAARRAAGIGLTTPELAVVLAYAKMELYDAVLASDTPDDPLFAFALEAYFPQALRSRYPQAMAAHPLRREIIATCVVNDMVNRMGATFAFRLAEECGARAGETMRAYTILRHAYGLPELRNAIEALDGRVATGVQNRLFLDVARLAGRGTEWFVRRGAHLADAAAAIARFQPGIAELALRLESLLMESEREALAQAVARYTAEGVPEDIARRVVGLYPLYSALDITEIAGRCARAVEPVARGYFALVGRLRLLWLNQQIAALPAQGHWELLARNALRDDLSSLAAGLTAEVFAGAEEGADPAALVDAFLARRPSLLARYEAMLADVGTAGTLDLSMVSVILREMRGFM